MSQKVEQQKILKIIELKKSGHTHDQICKLTKSSKRTVNKICESYVYVPYPEIKLPNSIRETQYSGYYIGMDGTAYRIPGKYDKNVSLNEYGLIVLTPHLRGNPIDKKYQYPSINVSIKDSNGKFLRQRKVNIHRLVAETFIPNPNNYDSVDHIDRNKMNNHVDNLRWCSIEDNKNFWERDGEYKKKISKSTRENNLVYGIGFNDIEFVSKNNSNYRRWSKILEKCKKNNRSICEEWKKFSNFDSWLKSQNIDKNSIVFLIKGNEYGPENCIITTYNLINILNFKRKGLYPLGVCLSNGGKLKNVKYCSRTRQGGYLGSFNSIEKAHLAWQKQKIKEIELTIENEKNLKIVELLIQIKDSILSDILNQRETIKSPFENE